MFVVQVYHSRGWFTGIPDKAGTADTAKTAKDTAPAPAPAPEKETSAPEAEKSPKRSFWSFFRKKTAAEKDEIFHLDEKFDSLFMSFGVERSAIRRKINNFPDYYLDEKVEVPRGKPLAEYVLALQRSLQKTRYAVADGYTPDDTGSVLLEIARPGKMVRKTRIAYGSQYVQSFSRLAVVVEGFGPDMDETIHKLFTAVTHPLNIAIRPNHKFSKKTAEMARQNGWEILCQAPMESVPFRDLGPDAVYKHLTGKALGRLLSRFRRSLPDARGFAIYGGGVRIVENEPKILETILVHAGDRNMYFIDNSFAPLSRVREFAFRNAVPCMTPVGYADASGDAAHQRETVKKLLNHVRKTGEGIVLIKHSGRALALLNYMVPLAEKQRIRLVSVSSLFE